MQPRSWGHPSAKRSPKGTRLLVRTLPVRTLKSVHLPAPPPGAGGGHGAVAWGFSHSLRPCISDQTYMVNVLASACIKPMLVPNTFPRALLVQRFPTPREALKSKQRQVTVQAPQGHTLAGEGKVDKGDFLKASVSVSRIKVSIWNLSACALTF